MAAKPESFGLQRSTKIETKFLSYKQANWLKCDNPLTHLNA